MKALLQHIFNDGHVYCRLVDLGISKRKVKRLLSIYNTGRIINRLLYC